VESYSYDVFGEPDTTSSIGNLYMFTARRYDIETGNYYYRARIYKPSIGRFLQPDPIGYDDGLNMYAYVGNNPVNYFDPFGLCKGDAIKRIEQLSNYISIAEEAVVENIKTLEMLNNKKEFWHNYYQTVLVADASVSAVNWSGTAMKIKNLGWHLFKQSTLNAKKAAEFVGWAKVTDYQNFLKVGVDESTNNLIKDTAIGIPGTAASIMGLTDIPASRRKLINRNDDQINFLIQNINSLSKGVSEARNEIRRLTYE